MSKFLNISIDNTLGGNSASDDVVSSQKAVKDYVDNRPGLTVDQTYNSTSTNAQSGTAVAGAISTKANDSDVIHKTGDETKSGIFNVSYSSSGASITQIIPGTSSANSYIDLIHNINNTRRGTIRTTYNPDGSYQILLGCNGPGGDAPTGIVVKRNSSSTIASAPESTVNGSIVVSSSRTVADKEVKFSFGNGFKVATKEISPSAAGDTSWSYGITFTNIPTILAMRRTGASTTSGSYQAWVRGDVGKSSCKVYSTGSATWMLLAIGN